MNRANIIRTIRNFYTQYLKSIKDNKIKELIKNHTFVTGGAITSLLLNENVNDYDLYFDNEEACREVIRYYLAKLGKKEPDQYSFHNYENMQTKEGEIKNRVKLYIPNTGFFKSKKRTKEFYPIFVSTNAMTLTNDVQLIFRFVGDPEEIHKNYDFEHTKCYYIYKTNTLVLPPSSIECILNKELKYSGSKYPLASIIRTRKFIQRGWNINAGQFLKMVLQLQSMDLNNPIVLSDQLTGVDIVLFDQVINKIKEADFKDGDDISEYVVGIIDEVFDGIELNTEIDEDKEEVIINEEDTSSEDWEII